MARLTDTLIIDADGTYDLRDLNDRLRLGLKSTMSEAGAAQCAVRGPAAAPARRRITSVSSPLRPHGPPSNT
jgi:hypothetical protein